MDLNAELTRLFGFKSFRPGQRPLIEALIGGRSALGILPTGGGKSLCYQMPALLLPGLTVVVSPLIALMHDQVENLRRRGIGGAVEVHSSMGSGEANRRLREAATGRVRLLYLAPERLAHGPTVELLRRASVTLFVVDEAHCIAHWGHDFRPEYLVLADRAAGLGARLTLALTATATPRVREEIIRRLRMLNPVVIVNPFDRPNLWLGASACEETTKVDRASKLLGSEGSGIVYVGRQADTLTVASELGKRGISAVPYHGGLNRTERSRNQDAWIRGDARVVVGTVAFGMGIDKPDVRTVVHLCLPPSLEAYYQESGRAGRDELPARCWLLASRRDSSLQHWFIERRHPTAYQVRQVHERLAAGLAPPAAEDFPTEKWASAVAWLRNASLLPPAILPHDLDISTIRERHEADSARLEAMIEWAGASSCRRSLLLRYFGERVSESMDCDNCDNCRHNGRPAHGQARALGIYPGQRDPAAEEIRAALLDAVEQAGPRGLNRSTLRMLLAGAPAAVRKSLQKLASFASLKGLRPSRLAATEAALVEEGLLDEVAGARPRLCAPTSRTILPPEDVLPVLRLVGEHPGRFTKSQLSRTLGGEASEWGKRIEALARSGYLGADGEARLLLTTKGSDAIEASDRRGVG